MYFMCVITALHHTHFIWYHSLHSASSTHQSQATVVKSEIFTLLAKGGTHLDKAAFTRLMNMMGQEGETRDDQWKGFCAQGGASPEEGLPESVYSMMMGQVPPDKVQVMLTKLREEAEAQAKVLWSNCSLTWALSLGQHHLT